MSRYIGPRLEKYAIWELYPGLTGKTLKFGSNLKKKFHSGKKEQYRIRLQENQKLFFHYGLTEEQLLRYVHIAGKAKRSTGQVLLQLLEVCLDNIFFDGPPISKQ
jgi:small subunit ribosomal protein S4